MLFGDEFALFLRKGVYPYDYMDSFERFDETSLPPREAFYNTITESDISEEDYEYALKVWNVFKCETLRDFHTLYMKCDVALICDVFEHFCKIAHVDYKLDPKYYITLPSFSFDAIVEIIASRTGTCNLPRRISLPGKRRTRRNICNFKLLCPKQQSACSRI